MAALVIEIAPTLVCIIRRSDRMRASTGKAVMHIEVPTNIMNEPSGTPAGKSAPRSTKASSAPRANGTTMPA